KEVVPHLWWSGDEIRRLLSEVDWEEWQRGDAGQDLYMLLMEDPQIKEKMERVALEAIQDRDDDIAWAAMYLTIYWAREQGAAKYEQFLRAAPAFRSLPLAGELELCLREQGYVILFE